MKREVYKGEALTLENILGMLRSQGLEIGDEKRALHIFSNVSYSRLKAYLVPLMKDSGSHTFKPGATLEQAYAIYGFDRRLRELIFHELEKVEISVRCRIAYATNCSEKGYWYINKEYFRNASSHNYILRHISQEVQRSDNDAIKHFRKKYSNEYLPIWLAVEAMSMGSVATLFYELKDGEIKDRIASYYGLKAQEFSSWLSHFVYIRNACAHHNRMWNNRLDVLGRVPENAKFPRMDEFERSHIYFTFCAIKFIVDTIKPENTFAERLSSLLGSFNGIDYAQMGFPNNWRSEKLWKIKEK